MVISIGKYRLELGISNATTQVVVVMFDETASMLVKCSDDSLAQSDEEYLDGISFAGRAGKYHRKEIMQTAIVLTSLKPCEGKTPIRQELEDSDADSVSVRAEGRKSNVYDSLAQSDEELHLLEPNSLEAVVEITGSGTIDAVPNAPRSSGKRLCKQPSVLTSLKPCEGKTLIRQELEDSDADSVSVRAEGKKKQRVLESE
nr:hypothetical protein [Tanacetum cinerariifolium]